MSATVAPNCIHKDVIREFQPSKLQVPSVQGRFRTIKPFSLIFSPFLSAMAAPLEEFIDFSEINSVQKCLAFLDDENSPTHTRSVQPGFQN
jgi:hypothetical protein